MKSRELFAERLRRRELMILDGGLATELEAQGCDISSNLWSADILRTAPERIVAAHRAFLNAGAECVSTASYQASREGFRAVGVSSAAAENLMLRSVALAHQACNEVESNAFVAASLGPYGAVQHDGSEYHGQYAVDVDVLREFHVARTAVFDATDADVLAFETIPSYEEALVLADIFRDCQLPAWVSFSCRNGQEISDGTPVVKVAELFAAHPNVVAIGVNCTAPQYVESLLTAIATAAPAKSIAAYPNSGESYDVDDNSWRGAAMTIDVDAARTWIAAGATMIGGCCRVGPAHIRALADFKRALIQ